MWPYAPLLEAEAAQAEHGALDGQFFWVDRPDPEEASDDAVWVAIDLLDDQVANLQTADASRLGYREFALRLSLTNPFRAHRVPLSP